MFRFMFASIILAASLSMSGCVLGPCGGGHCHDCDGAGPGNYYAAGPLGSLRNWRRGLTCGSGCGEVYYDEWSSTPPDCNDPCPEFAGQGCGGSGCGLGGCSDCGCGCGVASCQGGCGFRPLQAIGRVVIGLYGRRFCGDCGYAYDDCNCDDPYASYGGAECEGCRGGQTAHTGGCASGNCGIASGNQRHSAARQQMLARQSSASPQQPASNLVIHPVERPAKFARAPSRLPQGPASLRR